jgi:hypothetical protein
VAVAAFCYTHYFAFFTVLAQTVFVAADLLWFGWQARKTGKAPRFAGRICNPASRDVKPANGLASPEEGGLPNRPTSDTGVASVSVAASALGFLYAGAIALLLYAPWLPVFLAQARAVHEGWWVPAPTTQSLESMFFTWVTGMVSPPDLQSRLWLGLLGAIAVWTLWRGGRAAWFFFLQAAIPWVCTIVISLYGGQSLLQERYLVFAQVGLFGFWSVTWRTLPNWPLRLLLAGVLGSTCVIGLVEYFSRMPAGTPAIVQAAAFLKEQTPSPVAPLPEGEGRDLFLIDDYREINRFRYYTKQAGLPWLDVKARVSPFQKGHVVHLASLDGNEVYWSEDELWPHAPPRVWRVSFNPDWPHTPVPGRKLTLLQTFKGAGMSFTVALYEH